MILFDSIFLRIASDFTPSTYLVTTKILGLAWSAADILLVYYFLKILNLAKQKQHQAPIWWRFLFLWISACLTPLLIIVSASKAFFILDAVICGIQYMILLISLVLDRQLMINFFRHMLQPKAIRE